MICSRRILAALRVTARSRVYRPFAYRHFTTTHWRLASENPDSFIARFKNTSIFRKLADKPEALQALSDFTVLLQENGLNLDEPPSTREMFRLATNSDFRQAAQRVVDELKKAGVDISSQEAIQEIMNSKKPTGDS